MGTVCWCLVQARQDEHQHGGRKPTETLSFATLSFDYKNVNLSNNFPNTRSVQIVEFPERSHCFLTNMTTLSAVM